MPISQNLVDIFVARDDELAGHLAQVIGVGFAQRAIDRTWIRDEGGCERIPNDIALCRAHPPSFCTAYWLGLAEMRGFTRASDPIFSFSARIFSKVQICRSAVYC